ncbi:Protein Shroom3, partial [Lamellibrachia satsuma]
AELMGRIKKKLEILVEEKRLLDEEIAENVRLGDELTSVVTEKVENKAEFAKYQLYVTELGKVMKLLLQLSGRLARANNAINALAEGKENKEKGALIQKRDELSEKHEDAKQLKEGIDRRSHQVAAFLRRHLLADEFVDYEHFIKMKCKLMIEQQEIDDKIKLGREQLAALQQSIAESSA